MNLNQPDVNDSTPLPLPPLQQTIPLGLSFINPMSAHDLVAQDLAERKTMGKATYGRELNINSPEDMLQYAYEEALDLACYLRNEIEKRKAMESLGVQRPCRVGVKGEVTHVTPDADFWTKLLQHKIMPRFYEQHSIDTIFEMNEIREFIKEDVDQFPYIETHKRLSTAITRLIKRGYFYRPSRYTLRATSKYVKFLQGQGQKQG